MNSEATTVYVVRHTGTVSGDTKLIFGAPGSSSKKGYPNDFIFVTSEKSRAKKYAKEMGADFPRSAYTVEKREVKV